MKYALLIERRADGTYEGSVPVLPGIKEVGASREATIGAVRQALRARLREVEIVTLDMPDTPSAGENPWLTTAGMLADDPTLEGLLQDIYAARDLE